MIYVWLYGRLGNNLSQIAAAATLAKRIGCRYKAVPLATYFCREPDNCFLPQYLAPFQKTILRKVPFAEKVPEGLRVFTDTDDLLKVSVKEGEDIALNGYFQSPACYDEAVVRDLFMPEETTLSYIHDNYPQLQAGVWCSITVRRGDYASIPQMLPMCDMAYYRRAMQWMREQVPSVKFFVISDDVQWCRAHFHDCMVVREESPLIDLYLATCCHHNIISNSSFAWWGILLNPHPDKLVAVPSPWFGVASRKLEKGQQQAMPAEWKRISCYSREWRRGG